jgi:hypothetical protein
MAVTRSREEGFEFVRIFLPGHGLNTTGDIDTERRERRNRCTDISRLQATCNYDPAPGLVLCLPHCLRS